MIDERLTKTTVALLVAVRDHVEHLVGKKYIDAGQVRFTVAARQAEAKKLVDAGVSLRQAGKQLGVSKTTVQNDVSTKRIDASQKWTPKAPASKSPPPSDPEEERKQQRWAATSNLIDGILLFDRHKPGDGLEMAAAYEVDEVKTIHDQAQMYEACARIAKNHDAEMRAYEIRMRAARKAGELLKVMEKAKLVAT